MRQHKNSGQLLVIVALLVALILISSEIYVVEVGKDLGTIQMSSVEDYGLALELASRHVVTGSLADMTSGGKNESLTMNLQRLVSFVAEEQEFGNSILTFSAMNSTPFTRGSYISWGMDGFGVSSAVVDFNSRIEEQKINWTRSFTVNVTTSIQIVCSYQILNENNKQTGVNIQLTCNGLPTLAKQISILFDQNGTWSIPNEINNYAMQNFGNGTYTALFSTNLSDANNILVQATDLNGIIVQASKNSQPKL